MITPRARRWFCASLFPSLYLLAAFFLSLGGPTPLHAAPKQAKPAKPYALIFGTVWGPDDRPVYGVKVKIRRARDKKAKWELYSDHNGEFAQRVPAGETDYVIWADLKDFKPADGMSVHLVKEVNLHIYFDERQDMSLHLTR